MSTNREFKSVLLGNEIIIKIPVDFNNNIESLDRFQPDEIKEIRENISFDKFKSDCQFQIDYINQNGWSLYDGDYFELTLNHKQSLEEAIKQHIKKNRIISYDDLKYYTDVCFHIMSAFSIGCGEDALMFFYPQFFFFMLHMHENHVRFTLDQINIYRGLERYLNLELSEKEHIFDEGVRLFKSKNMSDAIECYFDYLRYFPWESTAYNNIGLCYIDLHSYDCAISNFKNALLANPNLAEAYQNLAFAYQKIGNMEKSHEYHVKFLFLKRMSN
ncbi:MAG: tetratricopeptide repeat protein [Parabacteroides sp.]|nr:tetratricopeptide repeat protein [Parabacteroides sp.]